MQSRGATYGLLPVYRVILLITLIVFCDIDKIFKHFENTQSPEPNTSFALLATESRIGIRHKDIELLRPLDYRFSLLRRHVVRYFGAVRSVGHHENFQFLE